MRGSGTFAVFAILALAASSATGQIPSFVPVNAKVYRLRTPDGTERLFARDAEEPNALRGDGDWAAELDGRRALVMKDVESASEREGYLFYNGYLVKQLIGGEERNAPPPPGDGDAAKLAALWPSKDSRMVAGEVPDIWSEGDRLRLWFPNPNLAGVLFAEISLAALALLGFRLLWLKALGVAVSLSAFAGLLMTSSRGALLGFLCALAAMVATRFKALFKPRRLMAVALAAAVSVACLFATGQADRMAKNLFNEGQRETSRLTIWREVPRMMADAPCGWGLGESGRAYIDWYQPESSCLLKDLISGHLTFLVETGWPVRVAYVFLWLFAGLVAFAAAIRGASNIPLAFVTAFGVAGCFNPVITVWELWVAPMLGMAALALGQCLARRGEARLSLRAWLVCAAAALAAAFAAMVAVQRVGEASGRGRLSVRKPGGDVLKSAGGGVILNGDSPDTWFVDDDYTLHGGFWWLQGRALRAAFKGGSRTNALGYARSLADVPPIVGTLVLAGEAGRDWLLSEARPIARKVVLISPPFTVDRIPAALRERCELTVVAGELAYRQAGGATPPPKEVRLVPGAELYIPGWLRYVP